MIPSDIVLLDKTEITAKTPLGQATIVVHKTGIGYSCALWSGDKLLASQKFGKNANAFSKAAVLAPLLIQAKTHIGATADKYPDGVDLTIRVEHAGNVHTVDGKLPLDKNQLSQFAGLLDFVKQVNSVVNKG